MYMNAHACVQFCVFMCVCVWRHFVYVSVEAFVCVCVACILVYVLICGIFFSLLIFERLNEFTQNIKENSALRHFG